MTIDKLEEIYKEAGISHKTVINEEQRILKEAQEANNLRIQLDVVNNWRESLDLKPIKQQQITTTTTDYVKLIDKNTNKQAELKQTKTIESLPPASETNE